MRLGEPASNEGKVTGELNRRRSDRILAPVRIRIIGNDASGVSFAEESVTVSFNQQGARISLTHSLLPDDIVLVKNMANDIEEEFRVVGGFQYVFGERREWGIEALNPKSGIWGVEFSPPPEGLQPKVLIECAACKRATQSPLSSIEYDVLLSTGLISRHCERCGETTEYRPSRSWSGRGPFDGGSQTLSYAPDRHALVSASEIMHTEGELLVSTRGIAPLRLAAQPYYADAETMRRLEAELNRSLTPEERRLLEVAQWLDVPEDAAQDRPIPNDKKSA